MITHQELVPCQEQEPPLPSCPRFQPTEDNHRAVLQGSEDRGRHSDQQSWDRGHMDRIQYHSDREPKSWTIN